jgi:hypothetical protein
MANPMNLGMIGIQSAWGAYLQAHTDGEMHASNNSRNEEETWFLVQLDQATKEVALQNWRTGRYLRKDRTNIKGCARADATVISPTETWRLESGQPFGVQNAVVIRSVADGTILGTNNPGNDDPGGCGGEVTSRDNWGAPGSGAPNIIPSNNSMWGGWWVITPATTIPSPGQDAWNVIGGIFNNIANKISPADFAAIAALFV